MCVRATGSRPVGSQRAGCGLLALREALERGEERELVQEHAQREADLREWEEELNRDTEVLRGICGDDSALWGYGRKPPFTHILPHYHVTWRIPAAAPLGDAFDLAHPPLPVLRTGAASQ